MSQPVIVFVILGLTLAAFVWNRIRYDVVALLSLLAAVLTGVVPADSAFLGFGHPAVTTVAAVLVLSRAFQHAGLVDVLARQVARVRGGTAVLTAVLTAAVALLSGFMNNVGALALLLPVALRLARERGIPASRLLMPLAFGSLLGGLTTLIGTPANIIISSFRAEHSGAGFAMFSFLPVGGGVALAGLVFLVLVGWRLLPGRRGRRAPEELFETAAYASELEVRPGSAAAGKTLTELSDALGDPLPAVAVVRADRRFPAHRFHDALQPGDILLVTAGADDIAELVRKGGLEVGQGRLAERLAGADDLQLVEAVVRSESPMVGQTVRELELLDRHGLHLLAVAREGGRVRQRLAALRLRAGDVLLLQGDAAAVAEGLAEIGCLPLVSRGIAVGRPRRLLVTVGLFGAAVAAMLFGLLPAPVALMLAAAGTVLAGVLPLREVYTGVDWPVIVLLGAMIPVGGALETTGGAALLADGLLRLGQAWPPAVTLAVLFGATMLLSNVINNAAAALLMAPVGFELARGFGVSADPFLMAVAVSASCAFLTPTGHQSNALVMGPGGYRFGDYWKPGLPLSLLAWAAAIALILVFWPL